MTTHRPASAPPLDQPYYGIPFGAACKRLVQKAFVYTGRASPSEYWFAALGIFLAVVAGEVVLWLLDWLLLAAIAQSSGGYGAFLLISGLLGIVFWIAIAALSLAQISLAVRRLHDAGDPGTYVLFALIPFVGGIVLLVFLLKAPSPLGQQYDLPPGATRGYLFAPTGSVPASPAAGPGAPGYGVPPVPAAPSVSADGFAVSTGSGVPAVPMPGSSVPPLATAPALIPPVPAAPVFASPVPPVPVPSAPVLSVPSAHVQVPATPAPFGVPPMPAAPAPVATAPMVAHSVQSAPQPATADPIQSIPGVVSAVPPMPAPLVVPTTPALSMPATSVVASAADDDLDSTRISARPTGSWRLVLADGRQVSLVSSARLGRDPGGDPSNPSALLVPVDDPAKSISKTHAVLAVVADGILITDLHSTNGTIVRTADGAQTALAPDAPYRVSADAELQIDHRHARRG